MSNTTRARQPHRKSRNGCRECKKRHVKCDEKHPSCGSCNATNRRCSFLDFDLIPHPPSLAVPFTPDITRSPYTARSPYSTSPANSLLDGASISALALEAATDIAGLEFEQPPPRSYDTRHLMLLHHLETETIKTFGGQPELFPEGFEAIFNSAVSAPYLMDELLAFSALHLSTIQATENGKTLYIRLATELQTRALTLFNDAKPDVSNENCMAMLAFSSMIGMHALFDAVASFNEFGTFLNNMVHSLKLYRGVSVVTQQAWPTLSRSEISSITDSIAAGDELYRKQRGDTENECDKLMRLVRMSQDKLGPGPYRACLEALEVLHWVFGVRRTISGICPTHITLAWPVRISTDFIELLEQRQPISLIILAHWAVLLHVERDFWVFGNAGLHMIKVLVAYLGSYWDDWLTLPRSILNEK